MGEDRGPSGPDRDHGSRAERVDGRRVRRTPEGGQGREAGRAHPRRRGRAGKRGGPSGVVESVKAVSEIFAPVSGTVVDVNKNLEDHPEAVNKDPYGEGWIAVLELSNPAEEAAPLGSAGYRRHIGET